MIKYITGNLLDSNEEIILHGVNCSGGFGSGFARGVLNKYPEVKTAYLNKYRKAGWYLGELQAVPVSGRTILDAATQQLYGKSSEGPYVSYKAVRAVIRKALDLFPTSVIAMPKIGCGLAGGNWKIVEDIINEETKNRIIHVYVLEEIA